MNKPKLYKPRDPFVQHLLKKKQGPHGKTKKTIRRDDKASLKKDYLVKFVIQ